MTQRFNSVDELIEDLREVLPLVAEVKATATRLNDRKMLAHVAKLESLFAEDARMLRRTFEKMKNPDGSIEFTFSPEAADMLLALKGFE